MRRTRQDRWPGLFLTVVQGDHFDLYLVGKYPKNEGMLGSCFGPSFFLYFLHLNLINFYFRNGRLQYAQELARYIGVDIYGACGSLKCSRMKEVSCFKILERKYKFYLAFENSNCKDYITEKFFVNGLRYWRI